LRRDATQRQRRNEGPARHVDAIGTLIWTGAQDTSLKSDDPAVRADTVAAMKRWRRKRSAPVLSVVVPVYDVAAWLAECLDSVLASDWPRLDVVVVDDGSRDSSGDIADRYAARDDRVRVVHTENRGLGAARNEGLRHVVGDFISFCDSDDVLPPDAYRGLVQSLVATGSDFVTGSFAGCLDGRLEEPRWMRRLHRTDRFGITADQHPEILGDVFAWNKVFRRSFWEEQELCWPEGLRYEDQPTTTSAYLAGRFDVTSAQVYHRRTRSDGSSITQQRSSLSDLRDRVVTKRMSLDKVLEHNSPAVTATFVDRVLPGDLHCYFVELPGCSDDWWELLRGGVLEFWGSRSLMHSGLLPEHRLTGWLVEQGRREDATAVMAFAAEHPVPRLAGAEGEWIDIPGLDPATVDPLALALRPHERSGVPAHARLEALAS
jgi:CDP-glycerol glycerophosphotransferase